jgi:putative oxidoreductase
VVAGIVLLQSAISTLLVVHEVAPAILQALAGGAGILLLAGLWTPIAGVVVMVIELWNAFSQPADASLHIILAGLGAALALLGPGAWSVDARLFGWKRLDL